MPQAEKLVIDGDLFHPKFLEFSNNKEEQIADLKTKLETAQKRSTEIIQMFGEQPSKMKLGDFLGIFQRFVNDFINAKEELAKRKIAEEKKKAMAEKAKERRQSVLKRGNLDNLMNTLADGSGLDQMKKLRKIPQGAVKGPPIIQASANDLQAAFLKVRGGRK